ncbi:MAG: hypothetical protein R3C68_15930 [Myxococcota bacterium]
MLGKVPYRLAQAFAQLLGAVAASLTARSKALIKILPSPLQTKAPPPHQTIVRRMLQHMGTAWWNSPMQRFLGDKPHVLTALHTPKRSPQRSSGREQGPHHEVSGHLGNWELLAQVLADALAHYNTCLHTIAKPLYDPRLTAWVEKLRSQRGLRLIWRGEPEALRGMLRIFRERQALPCSSIRTPRFMAASCPSSGAQPIRQRRWLPWLGVPKPRAQSSGCNTGLRSGFHISNAWHCPNPAMTT